MARFSPPTLREIMRSLPSVSVAYTPRPRRTGAAGPKVLNAPSRGMPRAVICRSTSAMAGASRPSARCKTTVPRRRLLPRILGHLSGSQRSGDAAAHRVAHVSLRHLFELDFRFRVTLSLSRDANFTAIERAHKGHCCCAGRALAL